MRELRTALITAAAGRRGHLRLQQDGLARSSRAADVRVIVAMREPPIDILRRDDVLISLATGNRLPLARARNVGALAAIDRGAELLIFLDVDCVPAPGLVERYVVAAAADPDSLLSGPVHYLSPPERGGYDLNALPVPPTGHAARPTPNEDELIFHGDHRLFWSLSFAISTTRWRTVGGFDERYEGYGGEDTDFGQRAKSHGIDLTWVGGAWAYHQYHPTSDPPVQHLNDILRNARLFHDRWGWWPMQGWLDAFESLGLIYWDAATPKCVIVGDQTEAEVTGNLHRKGPPPTPEPQ